LYFRQAVASSLHFRQTDASNLAAAQNFGVLKPAFFLLLRQSFASNRGKQMLQVTVVVVASCDAMKPGSFDFREPASLLIFFPSDEVFIATFISRIIMSVARLIILKTTARN